MLNRLLVPLDGSPAMAAVLPRVRELVGGTGAVVHLLAIRPSIHKLVRRQDRLVGTDTLLLTGLTGWPDYWRAESSYLEDTVRQEQAVWQEYQVRQGSQLAYDGVVVQREVRFGDPLLTTFAAAQTHAAHLIVVAAQPQRWPRRLLRPNLAQQLLTQSAVPVLAVPPWRPPLPAGALGYGSAPA